LGKKKKGEAPMQRKGGEKRRKENKPYRKRGKMGRNVTEYQKTKAISAEGKKEGVYAMRKKRRDGKVEKVDLQRGVMTWNTAYCYKPRRLLKNSWTKESPAVPSGPGKRKKKFSKTSP